MSKYDFTAKCVDVVMYVVLTPIVFAATVIVLAWMLLVGKGLDSGGSV